MYTFQWTVSWLASMENSFAFCLCAVGKQTDGGFNDLKLPGSLIYADEDLDEAAKRVLNELTGLKNIKMSQFKAYTPKIVRLIRKTCCGWNVFIALRIIKSAGLLRRLSFFIENWPAKPAADWYVWCLLDSAVGSESPGVRPYSDISRRACFYTPLCGNKSIGNVRSLA